VDGHADAQGEGGFPVADRLAAVGVVLVGGDAVVGVEPVEGLLGVTGGLGLGGDLLACQVVAVALQVPVAQYGAVARCTATAVPGTNEDIVHASIIDMTLRLPVDDVLFDELRTDFLWYERPEDLDGITQLVGTWFQDHIAPRLVKPETAVRGRVVINTTSPHTRT
jgi:hypothetical protein